MATQDDYVKTALRLPRDLHARVQRSADETSKSLNAEFVARLEASFSGGDQSVLVTAIARLNADLARSELEKKQLEIQAAYVARSLLHASELLRERLGANDQEVDDLVHRFVAQATPLALDIDDLREDFSEKSHAHIRALMEVRRSHYPLGYWGKALEEENDRRRELGLPVYEPSTSGEVAADIVTRNADGITTLLQAKEVKPPPQHELVEPAVVKRVSRKPPASKKSTKS